MVKKYDFFLQQNGLGVSGHSVVTETLDTRIRNSRMFISKPEFIDFIYYFYAIFCMYIFLE